MRNIVFIVFFFTVLWLNLSCNTQHKKMNRENITAAELLGNPAYPAISYGGYRQKSRDIQPTINELKNDMKILAAMGIKLIRTYNLQLEQAPNILKAIDELQQENASFEMYVMLGAWIDCANAWTDHPDHRYEDEENNRSEIQKAVELANEYPGIVKIIAVGNEAMVHWAWSYYVSPAVVLKYVTQLQNLKKEGKLGKDVWITSSDNFASWGGGDTAYHNEDLVDLIKAVDYISVHTYPFHDTHYNPSFWEVTQRNSENKSQLELIDAAMKRSRDYAIAQFTSVKDYVTSLGVSKPIHIGETGWATVSSGYYGRNGSHAADEYKQALYHKYMRQWTAENNISCFYFEAFDEKWKDATNNKGSENHFGLFTVDGKAKFALWELVDTGAFVGLTRNGNLIEKTYKGSKENLFISVLPPIILESEINE